ncbi:MAG: pantothenate kinase, partial [Hyphomonadaceae bacterium]
TVRAMQSGIYWGSMDMIEGLIRRIRAEYGQPMKTIATGGVASLFEGQFAAIDVFDQDITSRGLFEVFKRNGGKL